MSQAELTTMVERRAAGHLTPWDAERLLDEVLRLRRWLAYATENMTYPYVQGDLIEALSDKAPATPPSSL